MSDTQRPKSSGDKLSAAEVNQDLPIQMTAGETINGGTLPVAVYIADADGEVYACDGNDDAKKNFIGFAISNSTDGNAITVQTKGLIGGFSGLDAGKEYFVQDDKTLGTTPGTYPILVGIAISATQIIMYRGMKIKKGTGTNQSGSVTTGTDSDSETINCGFRPKFVILMGECEAICPSSNEEHKGGAVIFTGEDDGTHGNGIGVNGIMGGNFSGWAQYIRASASYDIFAAITVTLSVKNFTATGFDIHTYYNGGGNGSSSSGNSKDIKYIAVGD